MRAWVRAAAVTAALAGMVAGLTGCMTVHGETAIVAATTEAEAGKALERYVRVTNEAHAAFDADLATTVQSGSLGDMERASLTARKAVSPEGDAEFEPLELGEAEFHIPRQAGWPKYFLASAPGRVGDTEAHWLVMFSRGGVDADWKASYLTVLAPEDVPAFARDEDGYAEPLRADAEDDLFVQPAELGEKYTDFLRTGKGAVFAPGPSTTERRETRAEAANRPAARNEWDDSPADPERYPVTGLYTEGGGAVVFFTVHQHTKQTVADGYTPTVDPLVEPLLKGEAKRSLTQSYLYQQLVTVPEEPLPGARVDFLGQRSALVSAEGA
ncbi:hypothetical protein IF129_02745 [Streptomyces chumphonensis]|uniref:DUF8094 domain-containing protein n=1 Tax=Streptomyces chumphonensis TaxID=1214925 RepID=A0A927IB49_9ACTN|nr:hypothetical protein [Streptomyces chumphonensis]MBD3930495.1 hypothetical protein [Streptomyces chumphonensis]